MAPATAAANNASGGANGGDTAAANTKTENGPSSTPSFPPPKTDKPRPHVCGTCGRSFARLEHLKRHERSHTKEKPFECPQCTRCFARRDLLLRHQQKLHQAGAASSRPRSGRRESTSGMPVNGNARIRKNSIAGVNGAAGIAASATMRPRANTIAHIDATGIGFMSGMQSGGGRPHGLQGGFSNPNGLSGLNGFDFRGMSNPMATGNHGLPKLNTGLGMEMGGGLRTAPIPGIGDTIDIEKIFSSGSTINPAQLHFGSSLGSPHSPFQGFPPFANGLGLEDEDLDWVTGLDHPMMMNNPNDQALDGSSPSAISTTSQSGFSEVMLDGSNQQSQNNVAMWQNQASSAPMNLDAMANAIPELMPSMNTVSPNDLHDQNGTDPFFFSSPPPLSSLSPTTAIPGMPNQYFAAPMTFNSDSTSISSASGTGSARHSSVTSVSTDSITDATRHALLMNLSQPAGYGARKYSQPSVGSPLSPGFGPRVSMPTSSLPSTADLQRFVSAYIHYFHPHMPFVHVPTLSFDSPTFTSSMRSIQHQSSEGIVGGGGCLILSMAAIGALYEFEHAAAKELFESSKKMVQLYLEERRRAGLTAVQGFSGTGENPNHQTPLWLVQAMLLNLIYGHNCGDKMAAEIATTHCAALVSLAKASGIDRPMPDPIADDSASRSRQNSTNEDVEMTEEGQSPGSTWKRGSPTDGTDLRTEWFNWKVQEERKRTLFSVFVLSSLLVTAYNHAPRILNSEIQLDLPCDEDLWAADSPQAWNALGGVQGAKAKAVSFAEALSFLLTASQRQQSERRGISYQQPFGSSVPLEEVPDSELKPSTFGCYVLINALHVYIWETRQRHNGKQWKTQETEQMHAQIEPALKAWQAAWRSNPHHTLERPNPYGPLPADSIPLLDLAYVRLFVNLGRTKEAFWQRDFDAMSEEFARGLEIIQHAESSRSGSSDPSDTSEATNSSNSPGAIPSPGENDGMTDGNSQVKMQNNHSITAVSSQPGQSSKRERHLRKAANYAADSLSMSDKLGVTFADFTSRELPIQSAMCTFDCAQVLAEWIATVQERVGRYLGVLGRDEIDPTTVPAIMLLEDEDLRLLEKVAEILHHADMKMAFDMNSLGGTGAGHVVGGMSSLAQCGYGSKLLMVTAYMLEKAAVWPVTHVMARALETQAAHMSQRTDASVAPP